MKFSEMNISAKTVDALEKMKYNVATEVQQIAIPLIIRGEELVIRSKTGSGKTAAFGIGMIEKIVKNRNRQGLVVAPTRELALQITKELLAIAKVHRLRIYTIYGGQSINTQISHLKKGFDIVVATPGRLLDHVRRGTIRLSNVNWVVLDEADIMLDMGFKEDIDSILSETNRNKQLLMFSATIDRRIKKLSKDYMADPQIIEVGDAEVLEIDEKKIRLKRREKIPKLIEILSKEKNTRVIIFAATKRSVEYIHDKLKDKGFRVSFLHGGKTQKQRERTMHKFKKGAFKILVATDVAARGLHIENVELVVNFDRADTAETHRHRIGRTGRMGKKGRAIEFDEIDPRGFKGSSRRYRRGQVVRDDFY